MLATSPCQGKRQAGRCARRLWLQLDNAGTSWTLPKDCGWTRLNHLCCWRCLAFLRCPWFDLVKRRCFGVIRLWLAPLIVVLQQLVNWELWDSCCLSLPPLFRLNNYFIPTGYVCTLAIDIHLLLSCSNFTVNSCLGARLKQCPLNVCQPENIMLGTMIVCVKNIIR